MDTLAFSTLSAQRLQFCIVMAAIVHVLIIFGITWQDPSKLTSLLTPVVEITLVTHPSENSPEDAKFIAAEHQAASSPVDTELSPQSLQNADFPAQQMHDLWQPPQPQAELAAPEEAPNKVTTDQALEQTPIQPLPSSEANANIMSTEQQMLSQRIASLAAELADQRQQYAQMPDKRAITASAQAAVDAEYLYNWRMHIEKVGNLNYPAAARRLGLAGEVLLLVAINPDGSLNDVQIRQSSGSKILDEAALRIVKLAAPFQPLPPEILATTDILEIIRTWQFIPHTNEFLGT
ncbi:MAG: energy transducer TonB [Gammaproteobacteria bacterium]